MRPTENPPSNRNFGFLFSGIFALMSIYTAYNSQNLINTYGLIALSIITGLLGAVLPSALTPFTKAWIALGDLMSRLTNPLILSVLFFVLITPVALITRLFGRDELCLKKSKNNSYWIDRDPPGPSGISLKNQF